MVVDNRRRRPNLESRTGLGGSSRSGLNGSRFAILAEVAGNDMNVYDKEMFRSAGFMAPIVNVVESQSQVGQAESVVVRRLGHGKEVLGLNEGRVVQLNEVYQKSNLAKKKKI
ncbi:hypothetical protein V6N13_028989 [Hibiscus sabdariffa]